MFLFVSPRVLRGPKILGPSLPKIGAKKVQNFGRFSTTSDFDREYFATDWPGLARAHPNGDGVPKLANPLERNPVRTKSQYWQKNESHWNENSSPTRTNFSFVLVGFRSSGPKSILYQLFLQFIQEYGSKNKKLSYCWETVRRESMPRIAEIDVEMTT